MLSLRLWLKFRSVWHVPHPFLPSIPGDRASVPARASFFKLNISSYCPLFYCFLFWARLRPEYETSWKLVFSGLPAGFHFFIFLNVLKWPVFGDDFISETGLGATTFVPLGSLGHLRACIRVCTDSRRSYGAVHEAGAQSRLAQAEGYLACWQD